MQQQLARMTVLERASFQDALDRMDNEEQQMRAVLEWAWTVGQLQDLLVPGPKEKS